VFGIAGRWWRREPAPKREIALGRSARERLLGLAAMVPVALVTFGIYQVINWSFVSL
jgi:hypothetical protein